MDPCFEDAGIVFTGNYLAGPHARQLMSFLCTLRLAHPGSIFLSGPNDLAAAAFLELLKNLELAVALNAVGTAWAEQNHDVFASYGVTSYTVTDLLMAMPPEHREFLTELAVSVKHDSGMVLTAMPATTLTSTALTSEFASDFFTLPHPLHDPTASILHSDSTQHVDSPSTAKGCDAAEVDGDHVRITKPSAVLPPAAEVRNVSMQEATETETAEREKTMYVDPLAEFPALNADGIAVNGAGVLAALFFPSGRVVVVQPTDPDGK